MVDKGIKPAGKDSLAHANSSSEVSERDLTEGQRRRAGEMEEETEETKEGQ